MQLADVKGIPQTHEQFLKWQVLQYNELEKPANGFVCTVCKNRRYFAFINYAGDFALRACTCLALIERRGEESKERAAE